MPSAGNKSLKSSLLIQTKLIRRAYRRAQQSIRFRSQNMNQAPILFANSFPKSGTHLLIQVLAGFTQIGPAVNSGLPAIVTFDGASGRQRSSDEIIDNLKRLLPGDIAYGHLHAERRIIRAICSQPFAPYFILRDPRDVAVSHVHYITDMAPGHIHHRFYREELPDFDARLKFSIEGNQDNANQPGTIPIPDIGSRLEPYLDWLSEKDVLSLQYEKLITQTRDTLEEILQHAIQRGFVNTKSRSEALQILENSIDPSRSPTYRSGKIGAWRSAFSAENKQLFKEKTGDMLIRLGYEDNSNW
jgi:hypothetical protein